MEEKQVELAQDVYEIQMEAEYVNPTYLKEQPQTVYRMDKAGGRYYYTLSEEGDPTFFISVTTFIKQSMPTPQSLISWMAQMGEKEAKAYADAVKQMEVVLRLVPQDSEDFAKAQSDLEEFKVLLTQQQEEQLQAQQEALQTTLPSEPEPEEVEAALAEEQEPLQNPEETTLEEPKVSEEVSSGIVESASDEVSGEAE